MTLYLIRHARAGARDLGPPDDLERTLDEHGKEQAENIVELLAGVPVGRVLASPAVRCVQTVEPLATSLGLTVEIEPALLEGQSASAALGCMQRLAQDRVVAALCSHGDIIPDAIQMLAREGMVIIGPRAWSKGSTWQLNARGGDIVSAQFLGPF